MGGGRGGRDTATKREWTRNGSIHASEHLLLFCFFPAICLPTSVNILDVRMLTDKSAPSSFRLVFLH